MHEIAVLSPHRDDAAFSLFLSLSEWHRRGIRLRVINFFTRSNYAPYVPQDELAEVSEIRSREDRKVLRSIARSIDVHDVELLDAPVRYQIETSKVCEAETVSHISESELRALAARSWVKGEVGVVAPLSLGDHVDHRAILQAACRATKANRLAFYEDLPYATWTSPESLHAKVAFAESLTGRKLRPTVMRSQHAVFRKRQLVARYRSQIALPEAAAMAIWSNNYRRGERIWIPEHSTFWRRLLS